MRILVLCVLGVGLLAGCPSRAPERREQAAQTEVSSVVAPTNTIAASAATSAAASAAIEPKWLASAARAPAPLAERARSVRLNVFNRTKNADAVDAVLNQVAAQAATSTGLRKAAQLLHDAASTLTDPRWSGSGSSPLAVWLQAGGMALLVELTQRACVAAPRDRDIANAAAEVELPSIANSGGLDRAAMQVDRDYLRAAAANCAK